MRSRTFRHEDNGAGANVFYHVTLNEYETGNPKLILGFEKNPNEIYHDSKRTMVIFPPDFLELELNFDETRMLLGYFVEAVSTYMASIRERLYSSSSINFSFTPRKSDYTISLQAVNKKYSSKGDSRNSARLLMIIYKKGTTEEVLSIKLKKTRLIVLLQIIKSLFDEYVEKIVFGAEDIEGRRLSMIRIHDSVSVGEIRIHGREVQKFQDYIERIVFDFKYKVGSGSELFKYRQVSAGFIDGDKISAIRLKKFTQEHRIYRNSNNEVVTHDFVVNSNIAACFFILLPRSIEFNLKDVEVLEERNENSDSIAEPKHRIDKQRTSSLGEGDFILNTIESQIVLSINKKLKFDAKKQQGKLTFSARYRDFIIDDDEYKVGRTNKDNGLYETVDKLAKVSLDLKIDWLYIFAMCAEAVHSSKEMELNEFGNIAHSWRYEKSNILGADHYSVRVVADPNNKACVVILIDHFKDEIGEYCGEHLPTSGGARMRIPLFKEHVRTLLKGLVALSSQYDEYYWMKKFPAYSENEELDKTMTLGLKRFYHTKQKREVVSFGIVANSTKQVYLTENDRDSLFFSAYYRLMYGRWLQFSGEQISISFDGWLTDRFNEYKIEFDLDDVFGARGSYPALAILFTTARAKNKPKEEEDGEK